MPVWDGLPEPRCNVFGLKSLDIQALKKLSAFADWRTGRFSVNPQGAEGWRSPKACGTSKAISVALAFWSASALWRFCGTFAKLQ